MGAVIVANFTALTVTVCQHRGGLSFFVPFLPASSQKSSMRISLASHSDTAIIASTIMTHIRQ